MVGRIVLALGGVGIAAFALLVLVGLGDYYSNHPGTGLGGGQLPPMPKLVGADAAGLSNQGMAVALSADGTTAIVGGPGSNNADRDRLPSAGPAGAAWVFTRRGAQWMQEGKKLVGTTNDIGGRLWSAGAFRGLLP